MRSSIQKIEIKLAQGGNLNALKRERTSRYKPGKNQDNGLLPGHRKKHDKAMERSMTRLWQEAWPGHGKKHDHIMEITLLIQIRSWKQPC